MNIVFINQFFWPDVAATGQLLTDLTRHLEAHHNVTVICSAGSYDSMQDPAAAPKIEIIRVPGPPFTRGAIGRALSYAVFFVGALCYALFRKRADVVVTLTTPPLLSLVGTVVQRMRGSRHVIWEMDMFPEVLVSLGAVRESSWIHRSLRCISNRSRRSASAIIALGPCMRRKLEQAGVSRDRIHVVENWADGTNILALNSKPDAGVTNVFYSGNLGLCHDVDTILAAMRVVRDDPAFAFTFAGGGKLKQQLAETCSREGLDHTNFPPYASRARMTQHLASATVGLVTERLEAMGTVVPSKVYGLMAAGKPILFIGPRGATPSLVVRRYACGWSIEPGDTDGLVALLRRLHRNPDEVKLRGKRARNVFERHYDLPQGVRQIARVLVAVGPVRRPVRKLKSVLTLAAWKSPMASVVRDGHSG